MVVKSPAGDSCRLADINQFGLLVSPFLYQSQGDLKNFLPGLLALFGSSSLVVSHRSCAILPGTYDMYRHVRGPTGSPP